MKIAYLCYAPEDYSAAAAIAQYLEAENKQIILDLSDDESNVSILKERILGCDIFFYLISDEALENELWLHQLDLALKYEKPVQGILVRHTKGLFPSPGTLYPIDLTQGINSGTLKRLDRVIAEATDTRPIGLFLLIGVVIILVLLVIIVISSIWDGSDKSTTSELVNNPSETPTSVTDTPSPTTTDEPSATWTFTPTEDLSFLTETEIASVETAIASTQLANEINLTTIAGASTVTSSPTNKPPTSTPTASRTLRPTATHSLTSTSTPTPTVTSTATSTATNSPPPPTFTLTATSTPTRTPTPTHTFTPSPTFTASATPTIDPNEVACPGAPVSRLLINDVAQVIHQSGISMREEPGTQATVISYLPLTSLIKVIDGPVCEEIFRWWLVERASGQRGWVAEGDIVYYYLQVVSEN